jgi:DNA adenine methylase
VLNDYYGGLIDFYHVAKGHFHEVAQLFEMMLRVERFFLRIRDAALRDLTEVEGAVYYFYRLQIATGANNIGYHFLAPNKKRMGLQAIESWLAFTLERIANAHLKNTSWQEVVKTYDSPVTFFYFDPPYWFPTAIGHSKCFQIYEEIADVIGALKGKAIVGLNEDKDVKRIFSRFCMHPVDSRYYAGAGKRHTAKDLQICSWQIN